MPQTGANRNLEHQEAGSASRCSVLAQRRAALEDAQSDEERFSIIDGLQDVAHLIAEVMAEGEDALHAPSAYESARFLDAALRQRKTMLAEQRGFWADPEPVCVVPYRASGDPRITVVIPVYNAERYVESSIGSVCRQTLEKIEVLCVDDGSSDGSLSALKALAEKDPRITVYSQVGSGQSIARNTGISKARGEFICYLDSDDMLADNALESLICMADACSLDVVFFNATSFFEDEFQREQHSGFETYYRRHGAYEGVYSGPSLMSALFALDDYKPSACLNITRKSYLERINLLFRPGISHEDNAYTYALMSQAERVAFVDEPMYLRRVRQGSIMTSPKRFSNAYGYYASSLDMAKTFLKVASIRELTQCEEARMRTLIFVALHNARKDYFALPTCEQGALLAMPEVMATAFRKAMDAYLDTPGSAAKIKELEAQVVRYQKAIKPLVVLRGRVLKLLRKRASK